MQNKKKNIQGKELCIHDFVKYIPLTLACDTCEPICSKRGMVLDMTKLYSVISV